MKKIINILKNKEIDVILLIIILVAIITLPIRLFSGDEVWNFANVYKMFNGYKIYKELNVIITPLFFYIGQILLKVFGATMLSFRIYNILIFSCFFILIYNVFKILKIAKQRRIVYTIILLTIFDGIIAGGANYNILVLIPILINLILILRKKDNNVNIGILLLLTFLIKQNVFVYYAIGILAYKFITRNDVKQFIIDIIKIYVISFIGIFVFLLYMYLDNNLYNFINYCFLGMFEFGAKNVGINFYDVKYTYISIFVIVFIISIMKIPKIRRNINEEIVKNVKIILCFGVPLLLIQYPILNSYHSILASLVIVMCFIYIIDKILIEELEINAKKETIIYKIIILFFILYYLYLIISNVIIEIKDGKMLIFTEGPYYGICALKTDMADIQLVSDFIKEQENYGKRVIVLSHKANLYNININKNNGVYDLYFLGNLGIKGEKGLIEEIKKMKNTIILTEKTEEGFIGQEAINARNYVINNQKKIGEIQEFCIYETK